ncbi:MAG: hypothetical protein MAG794_00161 [Gammaproteobacteria bacterium]|nr:hypothetical protein [Gammaproteobacteria bacterium]
MYERGSSVVPVKKAAAPAPGGQDYSALISTHNSAKPVISYEIRDSGNLAHEIERIVTEQIDRGIAEIDDGDLDPASTVHQSRKRCKKIRAVLRLVREPLDKDGTYGTENARFRDIARQLSALRDASVLIETHDSLAINVTNPDVQIECAAIRGKLTTRRRRIAEENANLSERLKTARAQLLEGRDRVLEWAGRARDFQDLEPGLGKTYRRGHRGMDEAYKTLSDETFHEFRKRVKYHWYACRLLRNIWPAEMDARTTELAKLSELLGDEHDLSVYRSMLESQPDWFGHTSRQHDMLAAADRRRATLRREARPLGIQLYAETPGRLPERFRRYWQAWRAEGT